MTRSRDVANIDGILTTTGDTYYASAAATPARLGVGSTGQVLTVAGGVPTWATPGGSTKSISLIASGSLSGASLTLSSLSSYDYLVVLLNNVWQSSGGVFYARINDNSTSNYWFNGFSVRGSSSYIQNGQATDSISTGVYQASGNNANSISYIFENTKSTGFTNFQSAFTLQESGGSREGGIQTSGIYAVNEAVSSLKFYSGGGTFSGGTYRIYGA